jgi:ComF family protein
MAMKNILRAAGRGAMDFLYPRICLACHADLSRTDRNYLCGPCEEALPRFGPEACPRCGQGLGPGAPDVSRCPDCRHRAPAFDGASAWGPYRDALRDLVLQLKFGGERVLADELGRLLGARLAADPRFGDVDVLVPVPLDPATEGDRGYNQSALLAEALGRRLGRPVETHALAKARATAPQATLDAARRAENVAGAFAAARPDGLRGRRVLLVDDVMTTGATASEAATVLKSAGAKTVLVAVVAR